MARLIAAVALAAALAIALGSGHEEAPLALASPERAAAGAVV